MIDYAIKFPQRISVEHNLGLESGEHEISLHFHGADRSRLTVILSLEQANAMMGLGSTDPADMARDLYVRGHIEVDEFERRLERINAR